MYAATIISSLLALAPAALAVGSAKVENNCDSNVYLWSVDSSVGDQVTLEPGTGYSEPFHWDDQSGGVALKITRVENGLYIANTPQTIFSYTLDGTKIWYDLSDVFGDGFAGESLVVAPADDNCPSIVWADGTPPAGSQTRVCGSNNAVTLTLCA
ncbi:putative BYS1 domain protein [Lineolata rhizophorae]|uniref:Putative BYS1 domain protein n=1 Tax=Lineolata rhizophorae TaxID=578093 RepID=A0A6A6NWY8_9PEZI|nr:putative BYS1 domain protein [Lineolata rhizophorae]